LTHNEGVELDVSIVRSPGDRALPRNVFTPVGYTAHAPRKRYRVTLRSPADVKEAAKFGVCVSLFESKIVRDLGYPAEFPTRLLVAREVARAVDSPFPLLPFANAEAARQPRLEDVVVAMLFVDWLGARALARKNAEALDPSYLWRRVAEERADVRAHRVRLEDVVPGPRLLVSALGRDDLRALDSTVYERPSTNEG
jgi:hypothetical protein